ncbi:ABC transporter substrate-binding protein [Algoriphagus mannitolivorans]|uniref:ABC transporter substrate-binding protein n=1 Tax=Algoriphagus mannitolivorans TaxID=226504 RepID=UPI000412F1AD|nr:ABC transporter substrate-binding protein [Algoriphagus mannitolivorans]
MHKIFLVILLFFTLQLGYAQGLPDNFQKAKNELSNKDYWSAVNSFKPFLDYEKYGNLANYAAFHSAEAYLQVNQPGQAIEVLRPVYSRNWNKNDEMKYLLAVSYFQNNQNEDALRIIKQIKDADILQKAYNATFEYVKDESSTFLVTNLREFKTNEGFLAALAKVLQEKEIMTASEREALKEVAGNPSSRNIIQDEVLDVVVLLPFTTGNSPISSVSTSDFVFELYQGIELGVEELKKQGTKVNLQTFDSKRDIKVLSNLLKDPVLSDADVIVGPIYRDETILVSEFAESEKIPLIHPLSNLGERFELSTYSYLFRPSAKSLVDGVVTALKSQNWGKKVAIGFSNSSRDERMARELEDELRKSGFDVVKSEKIDQRSVNSFLQGLGISRGANSNVHQVILLTDDPAIAQPTFSLIESITATVPVLVMDSWLSFNFANYEMLEFPNFYFISNNTPKFGSPEIKVFKEKFYEKYLSYPSINAILGAELVYWIYSNSDLKYGVGFRENLDQKSFQAGKYTYGFNFRNSTNNLYSPVFKLENGELIPLN